MRLRLAQEDSATLVEIADAMREQAERIEHPELWAYVEAMADALVSGWYAQPDEFDEIVQAWRQGEHHSTKRARCLRLYEGLSPDEAAAWDSTLNPLGFKTLRHRAGRDVETGRGTRGGQDLRESLQLNDQRRLAVESEGKVRPT